MTSSKDWSLELEIPAQDHLIAVTTLSFIEGLFPKKLKLTSNTRFFFTWLLVHLLQLEHINILFSEVKFLKKELFYWLDTNNKKHKEFSEIFYSFKEIIFQYEEIISNDPSLYSPIIHENKKIIYLHKHYFLQKVFLSNFYKKFLSKNSITNFPELILSEREKNHILETLNTSLEISSDLLKAIEIIHQNDLLILVGGPGTGKTTALSIILRTLILKSQLNQNKLKLKIILTAPTGLAQQRITDSLQQILSRENAQNFEEIPYQASTIHSLINENSYYSKQNSVPLLHADIVVIDEMSMVDIRLFNRLLTALPNKCKLILVGDPYQLPSIEPGSIFRDMLKNISITPSHLLNPFTTKLQKNYRTSENSSLYNFVNNFSIDSFNTTNTIIQYVKSNEEIFSEEIQIVNLDEISVNQLLKKLTTLYPLNNNPHIFGKWQKELNLISEEQVYQLNILMQNFENICILSARREKDPLSSNEINSYFMSQNQNFLNKFNHGTPVIITKNLEYFDLNNGTRGIVIQRDTQKVVYFRKKAPFNWKCLPINLIIDFIEPSYAMTIHKAQGSEFNNVCIILPYHEKDLLLTRSLFFTAITRAKKKLTICTTLDAIKHILSYQELTSLKIDNFFSQGSQNFLLKEKNSDQILLFDS